MRECFGKYPNTIGFPCMLCEHRSECKQKSKGAEELCGNTYTDLWVNLKYTLEGSEYCKAIRETDFSPAFQFALCQKCIDKNCRFISFCAELHDMNMKEHEDEWKVDDDGDDC